jgi:transcription elongation factor Elf1
MTILILHIKIRPHRQRLSSIPYMQPIGSPPQRQTLIVDTGSRLTAFPCQPHCPNCGTHASDQFHLDKSSSYEVMPCSSCLLSKTNTCYNDRCEIEQSYTEGSSWRAFEVVDKVWLGTEDENASVEEHKSYAVPFTFGCQVAEEGLFKQQYADGIMGLSMYTQTLAGTFHQYNSIPHESFSLCFNKVGGYLALGGTAQNHHLAPMQFTPFATKNTWYYSVTVNSVYVGSHKLPGVLMQYMNEFKGTIVDSGTTDTFLPVKIAKPFVKAWQGISGKRYSNSLQLYTYEEFRQLPTITFELGGGLRWEVEPMNYMEDVSDNTRLSLTPWHGKRGFISRMYVNEPKGAVLGSNAMMNHELYFDISNRRMGVAKASCT